MTDVPQIALCWDGETPTAELRIDEHVFTGDPDAVQDAFDLLNKLRDRAQAAEARLLRVRKALDDAYARGGWR